MFQQPPVYPGRDTGIDDFLAERDPLRDIECKWDGRDDWFVAAPSGMNGGNREIRPG
jgi:hypothetical protein